MGKKTEFRRSHNHVRAFLYLFVSLSLLYAVLFPKPLCIAIIITSPCYDEGLGPVQVSLASCFHVAARFYNLRVGVLVPSLFCYCQQGFTILERFICSHRDVVPKTSPRFWYTCFWTASRLSFRHHVMIKACGEYTFTKLLAFM